MGLMNGFFSNESTFGKCMSRILVIVTANLLFMLLCLPVITAGGAYGALHGVMRRMKEEGVEIHPLKVFFQELRKYFWQGELLGAAGAFFFLVVSVDLSACILRGGIFWSFAGILLVVGMLGAAVLIQSYICLTEGCRGIQVQLKEGAIRAFRSLPGSMLLVLIHAVMFACTIMDEVNRPTWAFVWCFFGMGLLTDLIYRMLCKEKKAADIPGYSAEKYRDSGRKTLREIKKLGM